MQEYGSDLQIGRQLRKPYGFKASRIHRSNIIDASTAKPGGVLNMMVEKIKHEPIVPGSMYLSIKGKPTSTTDKSAYFVQNFGRALIIEKQVKFNGKEVTTIRKHDEFKLYTDLWLTKSDRKERILQGIQEALALKHRLGSKKDPAGKDVLTGVTNKMKAITTAYGNTFYIPIDDELFCDVSPFCPDSLYDIITIEFKLAEAQDVVLSSDQSASYEITDIHLEWDGIQETLSENTLASETAAMYKNGFGVHYDRIHFWGESDHTKVSTLININIRESVRSLRGVLFLFKDLADQTKFACNRETFFNPGIEKIGVSINGSSNKLYANGLLPKDIWYEARKFFSGNTNMSQDNFYNDGFCLWIDTRSSTDNTLHGNGLELDGSKSGLNIAITKTSGGAGNFTMLTYLIIDSVIEFSDNKYKRICYALGSCVDGDGNQ